MNTSFPEISLDGFQVVGGDLFARAPRNQETACTLWPEAIGFSKSVIVALNMCEGIRIEVNNEKKRLLIIPVTSHDPDFVKWVNPSAKSPSAKRIVCERFTSQLYQNWGWNRNYRYKANGRLVACNGKVMMLFDFNCAEKWEGPKEGAQGA